MLDEDEDAAAAAAEAAAFLLLRFASDPRRALVFTPAALEAGTEGGAALSSGKLLSDSDAEVRVEELGETVAWSGFRPRRIARRRCF